MNKQIGTTRVYVTETYNYDIVIPIYESDTVEQIIDRAHESENIRYMSDDEWNEIVDNSLYTDTDFTYDFNEIDYILRGDNNDI